jgi:hypothetical protein
VPIPNPVQNCPIAKYAGMTLGEESQPLRFIVGRPDPYELLLSALRSCDPSHVC